MTRRRFLAPEVIQTSVMDCGPASLKCLLEGFGIDASYGRLREACQTEVDGTSIDRLEEVACDLGLQAEQVLVPSDQLLRDELASLPALAVVHTPSGINHFIVIWSRIGDRVQVMDPARGRRWLRSDALLSELYSTRVRASARAFRAYAASHEFLTPLTARLQQLTAADTARELVERALDDESHLSLAALDAAARAVAELARSGALRGRRERTQVLRTWFEQARKPDGDMPPIAERHWYALPLTAAPDGEHEVALRGALIVRVTGTRLPQPSAAEQPSSLGPELTAALSERPIPAWLRLWDLLRAEGRLSMLLCAIVAVLATSAAALETVLLRSQLELGRYLPDPLQRAGGALAALAFIAVLTLLQLLVDQGALRVGRRVEARLRVAILRKLPRLHDRYLHSRPISDMADRAHMVHLIRAFPLFLVSLLHAVIELIAVGAGLVWLDPDSLSRVAIGCAIALGLPLCALGSLAENDLRLRSHAANLSRFYFDALRGSVALHAHRGARAVQAEHEASLSEWKRASRTFSRASVGLEIAVSAASVALTLWLFSGYLSRNPEPLGALLFLFWSMSFPTQGREVAQLARQLPSFGNVVARLFEPLGAPEAAAANSVHTEPPRAAAGLALEDVTVRAAGRILLSSPRLQFAPAEHVAVVGASGAGKSTLLGLFLGWHRATAGRVLWHGAELDDDRLRALRSRTVWVDPTVQLWSRSLHENLLYAAPERERDLSDALHGCELQSVLETLPDGLRTELGESGCRLSGGEGQRVRLARGLLVHDPALVLLDEPFRGLDRTQRARLMAAARRHWSRATLLCVTHDIRETLEFPRVLVVEDGRIVEDGAPRELAARPDSRFASLLHRERSLLDRLFAPGAFRRLRIERGRAIEVIGGRSRATPLPAASERERISEVAT